MRLGVLESGEMVRQVCDDRAMLMGLGFDVQNFAYPFGVPNQETEDVVASCGYNSARAVGINPAPRNYLVEAVPPATPYHIRTLGSLSCDTNMENVKNTIAKAEATQEPDDEATVTCRIRIDRAIREVQRGGRAIGELSNPNARP